MYMSGKLHLTCQYCKKPQTMSLLLSKTTWPMHNADGVLVLIKCNEKKDLMMK